MSSSPEPDDEVIVVEDEQQTNRRGVHCVAMWKLKNFSGCQLECGEQLSSPLLSADSCGKFRWYLSIFPNGQAEFEDYVSICVLFIRSADISEDDFRANCKVSIIDSQSNEWISEQIHQNLLRFQFNKFVKREQLLANKAAVIPQNVLTVRCQISIFDHTVLETENVYDDRLKSFADDFRRLYESQKFTDITLETKDGNVSGHKVILAARSPVFAEFFRGSCSTYPLPNYEKNAIEALMVYFYCGRMEPTVSTVVLDLYDLAKKFELQELTNALAPNHVSVQTELTNEVFSYTWQVKTFKGHDGDTQTSWCSKTFHTGPSSRAWNLSLRLKKIPGDDIDQYLAVYLNKLWSNGDEKAINIRYKISLLDRQQKPTNTKEASKLVKLCGRFGFSSFVKLSTLTQQPENFLPSNTLTIRCDMTICDGASNSKVHHAFYSGDSAENSFYESLSSCLRELLHSERNSDVTVCATDREFRLHKSVLCARSTVFADFFDRYNNGLSNYTINIQGIRSEILELFFAFVYSGTLDEGLTCQTAPELFAAADHYKIYGLRKLCSEFMLANICEILVRVGQTSDVKIRDMIKDFVCLKAEKVLVSDQWSELVRNHPLLASDILKSLARGYQESKRRRLE